MCLCRPKVMQHAAQLLRLPISLRRHAAEHDLLGVVVALLRDENLEGSRLETAHAFTCPRRWPLRSS